MKYLLYITIYLAIGGIIYFNSCGSGADDTITNTTNTGCGPHHSLQWTGYNNRYAMYHQNGRTFIEEEFLFATENITNMCTKTEPAASGTGNT